MRPSKEECAALIARIEKRPVANTPADALLLQALTFLRRCLGPLPSREAVERDSRRHRKDTASQA